MIKTGQRRAPAALSLILTAVCGVAACTNTPPPPLVPRPPDRPAPVPPTQPKPTEIVVGVNNLRGGYNPHSLADLTPTTSALSSLMLPSVFRPGPDGSPQLDRTLMSSAEVTSTQPFKITYTLRREAGWSDGAPIAAEDFVYLWQQMRSQPGAANAAGYQLIDDVQSRQGGKTVEVTFDKPYPGWKSLFDHLLPAHLMKDAPGGWAHAMDNGYPASGGPFSIMQTDRGRGEIVLERNDRYWGRPPAVDQIVLRAADGNGVASALRTGDNQLAMLNTDATTMNALRELGPEVSLQTVPRPVTAQLQLRPHSPELGDQRVRAAVLAGMDRRELIDAGTRGGASARFPADSQVLGPSEPGYRPTAPPAVTTGGPDPERVRTLLSQAGYAREAGVWQKDGRPLNLVLAAPAENDEYVRIAESAQRQLAAVGIPVKVITPSSSELYGEFLTREDQPGASERNPTVDMAVAPRPGGGDPATMLASTYGCAGYDEYAGQPRPTSVSGFCDPALQPTIDAALSGLVPFPQADALVERQLWEQAVSVPLYQHAQVLAVHKGTTGVQTGPGFSGPFISAPNWHSPEAKEHEPGSSSNG